MIAKKKLKISSPISGAKALVGIQQCNEIVNIFLVAFL
jgi:hypothetical protein